MAVTGKLVGARVKRVEDPRSLLGAGHYVGNLALPRMAEMALVRSPYAHARINGIDVEQAKRMPGVHSVKTGHDLRDKLRPMRAVLNPEIHPGFKPCDWYPLALDKARHVGDPVALVVAVNR